VTIGAPITFDTVGPTIGFVSLPDSIIALSAGTYLVNFSVTGVEPNQFSLFDNGAPVAGSTYGSAAGIQQNTGQVIVRLAVGDQLRLENSGSPSAVTLQTLARGTQANVNASIVITRLS